MMVRAHFKQPQRSELGTSAAPNSRRFFNGGASAHDSVSGQRGGGSETIRKEEGGTAKTQEPHSYGGCVYVGPVGESKIVPVKPEEWNNESHAP